MPYFFNPFTGNLDYSASSGGGSGTVTSVSVASSNGFAGTVANSTTNATITLTTTITGLLKGNGTAISSATSGTDYSAGTSSLTTGILKSTTSTGALTIAISSDFPTLNQNTTGNAATSTIATNITGGLGGSIPYQTAASTTTMLANGTAGYFLQSNGTTLAPTWVVAPSSGFTNPMTTLGDIIYGGASGVATRLAGNTTSARQFLTSLGVTSAATAPIFSALVSGDIPNNAANTSGTAANVTTNANLTGVITSVGNATSINSQTGTGSTFVVSVSPSLTTPNIGAATGTSLSVSGSLTSTVSTGTAPLVITSTTQVANLNAATAGTATNATNVATTATNTSASTFYPVFVSSATSSNQGVDTSTGLTWVPTGGTLTATTFAGALTGNASTATSATISTNLGGGSGGTIPYQTSANVTSMLANGTAGYLLQANGTTLAPTWVVAPSGFANPMTTLGDVIYGGASGAATRLPVGSNGNVLTVVSGSPAWSSAPAPAQSANLGFNYAMSARIFLS